MMEAAERQSRMMKERGELKDELGEEEEQFDPNHILRGIATLSGSCGTYVVREPLTVISSDPRHSESEKELHKSQGLENNVALKEGQKCQIVDFEDGIARLARNKGYLKASPAQLVKGKAIDESPKFTFHGCVL